MDEDPDQIIREVGYRIAELREGRGMTQSEFARKLGATPQYVYRMEKGVQNLTLRTMVKVASALGIRTEDLIVGTGTAKSRRQR